MSTVVAFVPQIGHKCTVRIAESPRNAIVVGGPGEHGEWEVVLASPQPGETPKRSVLQKNMSAPSKSWEGFGDRKKAQHHEYRRMMLEDFPRLIDRRDVPRTMDLEAMKSVRAKLESGNYAPVIHYADTEEGDRVFFTGKLTDEQEDKLCDLFSSFKFDVQEWKPAKRLKTEETESSETA